MSKGETAPEPSMDEILSSIRKIIAEDEVDEGPPATAATVDAGPGDDDGAGDDDILELTEDDEVDVSTEAPEALVDDEPEYALDPEPAAADEVEPPGDDAPVDAFERFMDPAPHQADDAPADDAPDEVAPEPGSDGAAVMMNEMTEVLLDSGTATAASGALHRLSAAMAPGTAIPQGDRTIEAFLADLVRPELKAWLDEHLPGLVERIVEREIRKLVRDAQPE